MKLFIQVALLTILSTYSKAIFLRNNGLIHKMVTHFQEKENLSSHDETPDNVLGLMQNVLCKNFPTIPCNIITQDETLKHLIQKSIQQLKYKKFSMEKSTQAPLKDISVLQNTEDLTNMQTDNFDRAKQQNRDWMPVKSKRNKKKGKKVSFNGHKKLRKFYPHKIKQKEKLGRKNNDRSEEKMSMSVEIPDGNNIRKTGYHSRDQPIWRIDYSKHGEPSLNIFDDRLRGKIIQGVGEDNVLEQEHRRDVLHPDVYIKKNFIKKNIIDVNSDNLE